MSPIPDLAISCQDAIEVDVLVGGYGFDNITNDNGNEILPFQSVNNHFLQNNDDTSTIISESILESNSDPFEFVNYDSKLDVEPSALSLQKLSQSIRGSKENPGKICIENSSDVLFGSKTFFTGPVVIKQFIAESDTANTYQKEEYSDVPDSSEISNYIFFHLQLFSANKINCSQK